MRVLKLSPEQKAKLKNIAKTQIQKQIQKRTPQSKTTKPTVKPKSPPPSTVTETKTKSNFWNKEIDLKFMKVNGKQLVIGSTVIISGIAYLIKSKK